MIRTIEGAAKPYIPLVYSPVHGKKVTARVLLDESASYSSRNAAKRVHRRMEDRADELAQPVEPQAEIVTVRAFVERWLQEWPRGKGSTRDTYRRSVEQLVAHEHNGLSFGDLDMTAFTRDQARAFVAARGRDADVARTMFNDAIYLAELPGLVVNPFARVPIPKGGRRELALTWDELQLLADCAPRALGAHGQVMRAAILFAAGTGLRMGEMCELARDWIDGDSLTVRATYDPKTQATTVPKGGSPDDVIAILPFASRALREIPRSISPYVFTLKLGSRWTPVSVHGYFRQIRLVFLLTVDATPRRRELLERELVFHTLRHTHATLLAEAGFDRWEIAAQMRHKDPRLVDLVYRNVDAERNRARIVEAFKAPRPAAADAAQEETS